MARGASTTSDEAAPTRSEPLLSRREVAELGGIPLSAIDKAVEQGVVEIQRGPRGAAKFHLSEFAPLVVMHRAGIRLPVRTKREIRNWLATNPARQRRGHAEFPLSQAVIVRYGPEMAELVKQAARYARLRDKYIETDREVKGGAPVIKGTRLTTRAVAARLEGGDPQQTLIEDYPYVDPQAFEVATIYERTHPRRGRPRPR